MGKTQRYSLDIATPLQRCNGKVAYDKKGAVTVKNLRWKEARVELRIYECPFHRNFNRHWHVTSQV